MEHTMANQYQSSSHESTSSILLMEGDPELRKATAVSLEQQGWRVLEATNLDHAQAILDENFPDILMLELDLPYGICGLIIKRYREHSDNEHSGKVLLIADQRPGDEWRRRYHPDLVIYKPYDIRHVLRSVQSLAEASIE